MSPAAADRKNKRRRPTRRLRIWVVSHCEVFFRPRAWFVDEAVMHLASSLRRAEEYMRSVRVEPGTWWRIQAFGLDDDYEGPRCEYSPAGRRVRKAPVHFALRRRKLIGRRGVQTP